MNETPFARKPESATAKVANLVRYRNKLAEQLVRLETHPSPRNPYKREYLAARFQDVTRELRTILELVSPQ